MSFLPKRKTPSQARILLPADQTGARSGSDKWGGELTGSPKSN